LLRDALYLVGQLEAEFGVLEREQIKAIPEPTDPTDAAVVSADIPHGDAGELANTAEVAGM
jgi:hypothetical protein